MGRTSVLASNVAVVSHRIAFKGLAAKVTGCDFLVAPPVFSCNVHRLGVSQHRLDLPLFFLERIQEMLVPSGPQ